MLARKWCCARSGRGKKKMVRCSDGGADSGDKAAWRWCAGGYGKARGGCCLVQVVCGTSRWLLAMEMRWWRAVAVVVRNLCIWFALARGEDGRNGGGASRWPARLARGWQLLFSSGGGASRWPARLAAARVCGKLGFLFCEMKMMTWQPSIGQLVSARIVATWLALVG